MRRFATGLLLLISSLCLFLSSTSLWVRHNVINTGVFVSNVTTVIDLPQVQTRITGLVTTTVMTNPRVQGAIDSAVGALPEGLQQFKPTVTTGIQNVVAAGVEQLLANQPFRPLTTAALTSAHDQLVNGQPVRFTLGQAKNLVSADQQGGLAGQVLGLLPDGAGFTLVTPADAPRLYNAVDLLKSVWWWVGLVGLAALAGALALSRRRRGTLRAWAVTTSVLAFLVLIVLRVTRGPLLVQVKAENRDAVGAVYDVFAGSLRGWTLWLLAIGLFILVETLVWGRLGLVAGVRRGWHASRESVRRYREQRALTSATAAEATAGGEALPDGGPAAQPGTGGAVPWYRRVAVGAQAFVASLELSRRSSRAGIYVARHFEAARWIGIVLGVLVLLLWPSPTLSVVIWIGALVALWIGALVWLRNQAPAELVEAAAEGVLALDGTAIDAGGGAALVPEPPRTATVPTPRAAVPSSDPPDPSPADRPNGTPPPGKPVPNRDAIAVLTDRLDLLSRLGTVHDAGVLTDEEFGREKDRLLSM